MPVITAIILLCSLIVASPTYAQDELVGRPPRDRAVDLAAQPESPPAPKRPSAEDERRAAGDRIWKRAKDAILNESYVDAVALLGQLVDEYPEHDKTPQARRLIGEWQEAMTAEIRERRRQRARTRLVVGQGLHGVAVGIEAWHLAYEFPFEDSGAGVALGLGVLGGIAGATTALLLTPDGIEPGHAGLLNSAPIWGSLIGYTASRTNYGIRNRGRIVTAMLGQAGAMGAAHLAWHIFEPTNGQTWIVDSTAFWTTALLTTGLFAADTDDFPPRRPILAGMHLWGATAGLVGGAFLASTVDDISVARVMGINLFGLLGGVVGLIATVPARSETASAVGVTVGVPVGLLSGVLIGRALDQKRREREGPRVSLGVMEFDDGTRGLTLGGRF